MGWTSDDYFRFGLIFIEKIKMKPVQTGRFRFGFLGQKPVQTGLAWFFRFCLILARFFRFDSIFSVWLGFFFFGSVWFGSVFLVLGL
jgi:hypothetical protein